MSLYYQAVNKNEDIHFEADEVYKKILKENIFAIAKTEMAKTITERTLAGYKSFETNVQYIDGFVEAIKESPAKGKSKVEETFKNVKFDVVIGNPPYQEESIGDSTQAPPIYHKFMDTAYEVADKAVLITPGRFLFNAGATGKAWNEKMLNDEHLKVIFYEQDSSRIFPNTDIKGGVAVTYRSVSDNFGAIGTFTSFEELNSILHKVSSVMSESFSTIFYPQTKVNQQVDDRFPTERRMRPNWFEKFPEIFLNEPDNQHTIKIVGLEKGNKRTERFVSKEIIADSNIEKFKVFVTEANGSGNLGEILSSPIIGEPQIGCTQTFLQVGSFDKKSEAENCLNYIKTKFSRAMLGLLKITQHNPPTVWAKVPLQDFTPNSDIDWTKSIPEIDQQLYTKYGLSQDEIDFIEEKVKVME